MSGSPCKSGRTPDEIFCPHMAEDKNSEQCVECPDRLKYAVGEGMLSEEVLEQKEDPVVVKVQEAVVPKIVKPPKTVRQRNDNKICTTPGCNWALYAKGKCKRCYNEAYREKIRKVKEDKVKEVKEICDEDGCDEEVKARGKCQNHYRVYIRNNPDKARKYQKHRKMKRAQINLHFGEGGQVKEIINELQKIAEKELRRTTEQALYFIKQGIENWKAKS